MASEKSTMRIVVELLDKYIKENELHFSKKKNSKSRVVYEGGFSLPGKVYQKFPFRMVVREEVVLSYIYLPASAGDRKEAIAEFIHRANYGMWLGRFEMDYNDGEIRFQVGQRSVSFLGSYAQEIIKTQINLPPSMMARYADGLASVLQGLKKPDRAVSECEDA